MFEIINAISWTEAYLKHVLLFQMAALSTAVPIILLFQVMEVVNSSVYFEAERNEDDAGKRIFVSAVVLRPHVCIRDERGCEVV